MKGAKFMPSSKNYVRDYKSREQIQEPARPDQKEGVA